MNFLKLKFWILFYGHMGQVGECWIKWVCVAHMTTSPLRIFNHTHLFAHLRDLIILSSLANKLIMC